MSAAEGTPAPAGPRLDGVDHTGQADHLGRGDKAPGRLLQDRPARDQRRPTPVAVLFTLTKLSFFAAEAVLTAAAAQLTGLSGWQLLLFALGTTAALFAGAHFVAAALRAADADSPVRQRRIMIAVAVITSIAMLLTAWWLATLREAYAAAVFTTEPLAGLSVDAQALSAVGRIGIALLVVVVGLDYGLAGRPGPDWAQLTARAARRAAVAAGNRRLARLHRAALRETRRKRERQRAQLANLDANRDAARTELAGLAAALGHLIDDTVLAQRQQGHANTALLEDFRQHLLQAYVPWSERILARLRGARLALPALTWPESHALDEDEVLARARRVAAPAVDTLEDLGLISPQRAHQLRGTAGAGAHPTRPTPPPPRPSRASRGAPPPSSTSTRVNGAPR